MQTLLKKQNDSLLKLVDLSEDNRKDQMKSLSEIEKNNEQNEDSNKEVIKVLGKVNDSIKNGFEKSKLANNMAKLAKTMEKSFSKESVNKITEVATGRREYRGIGERIRDKVMGRDGDNYDKDSLKYKFTTLRGFADMTGAVKRDSTGVFGDILAKREEKQKYIENAVKLNPQEKNLKQYGGDESKVREKYGKQFEEVKIAEKQLSSKQREIDTLKEGGLSDEEIQRTTGGKKLLKEKASLATTLGKTDFRFKGLSKKEEADDADKPVKTNNVFPISSAKDVSSKEAQNENARAMQEQTGLLYQIEENTRPGEALETKKKDNQKGGGIFSSIIDAIQAALGAAMGSIGSLLMKGLTSAMKWLFNPMNIIKMLKGFALVAIVGSVVNGLIDGVKAFVETGSITEALIAGFGGMLEFLTFGLFDAESLRSLVDGISGFVNDYIIEPIENFMGFLGESFDKYIAQPIMEAFSYIGGLFTEYIVDPIKKFFAPIADFFAKIKDQVFGFLEDFGIPEIGFTIPVIGKKVSIGPFYPFRPEQGANRVSSSKSLDQSGSSSGEDSSNFKQNITSSDKDATRNKAGASSDEIKNIIKEDEAYQKLSFFDKRKVDVGYAKATELIAQQPPSQANTVAKASATNEQTKIDASKTVSQGNTLVAPTTNISNTQNQVVKLSPRNTDPSLMSYLTSRY